MTRLVGIDPDTLPSSDELARDEAERRDWLRDEQQRNTVRIGDWDHPRADTLRLRCPSGHTWLSPTRTTPLVTREPIVDSCPKCGAQWDGSAEA